MVAKSLGTVSIAKNRELLGKSNQDALEPFSNNRENFFVPAWLSNQQVGA